MHIERALAERSAPSEKTRRRICGAAIAVRFQKNPTSKAAEERSPRGLFYCPAARAPFPPPLPRKRQKKRRTPLQCISNALLQKEAPPAKKRGGALAAQLLQSDFKKNPTSKAAGGNFPQRPFLLSGGSRTLPAATSSKTPFCAFRATPPGEGRAPSATGANERAKRIRKPSIRHSHSDFKKEALSRFK